MGINLSSFLFIKKFWVYKIKIGAKPFYIIIIITITIIIIIIIIIIILLLLFFWLMLFEERKSHSVGGWFY